MVAAATATAMARYAALDRCQAKTALATLGGVVLASGLRTGRGSRVGAHAAEADVAHAGVRRQAAARARPVARAVALVAQERTALGDALGLPRIVRAQALRRPLGVAARRLLRHQLVRVGAIPVRAPVPDVARH